MKDGYRHELKFLISRADAALLKLRLPHIMERDPHAGPTGQYTIRSLYFDDFHHSAAGDKLSGIEHRVKYRIRYYNYDHRFLKLEKKEKHNALTRKTAVSVTETEALALQDCRPLSPQTGLVQELQLACRADGLRPVVLVDYDRTPFLCRDGNTRITLDENLRTRPHCAELFASPAAMIPVLPREQVILEVKFDDFLPGHLRDALTDIPKDNLAISKFALCMGLL